MITLRPVRSEDIRTIYEIRNHPQVRKNMFDSDEIAWEKHRSFWEKKLREGKSLCYMVTDGKEDIGLARLDPSGDAFEVDILVSPKAQNKGIGSQALALLLEKAPVSSKIIARVKPDNAPSQRIFEKNGFRKKYVAFEYKKEK
ncbi:MAG: GNAT family N-acetyltransferase [Candidatus Micrarchaeota archaeon]